MILPDLLIPFGAIAAGSLNMWIDMRRRRALHGSHPRFVFASVERITVWVAIGMWTASGVYDISHGNWLGLALAAVVIACEIITAIVLFTDKDDNWFTRTGRKLGSSIRQLVAGRRFSAAAGAAFNSLEPSAAGAR